MSPLVIFSVATFAIACGWAIRVRRQLPNQGGQSPPVQRILLPFTGSAISRRALDAAVRLARAENATLMPAYLAVVPRNLDIEAPIERVCGKVLPLLDAIEQRATRQGIRVESRIQRGRTYRDALSRVLDSESFDRVVVPASADGSGIAGKDIVWLLTRAPTEVVIVRPDAEDHVTVSAAELAGRL
jgi:nucleotide-binding universal stress UspA family protein